MIADLTGRGRILMIPLAVGEYDDDNDDFMMSNDFCLQILKVMYFSCQSPNKRQKRGFKSSFSFENILFHTI